MSTLAERLEIALKGPPKKTQKGLADACNIKPPSVSDWLSGRTKNIEGENLLNAAEYLNVEPRWLISGTGPMRSRLKEMNINTNDQDLIDMIELWNRTEPHLRPHIFKLAGTVEQLADKYSIQRKNRVANTTEQNNIVKIRDWCNVDACKCKQRKSKK